MCTAMRVIAFLFILPVTLCITDDELTGIWVTAVYANNHNISSNALSGTGGNQTPDRPDLTPTRVKNRKNSKGTDQTSTHRDESPDLSPINFRPSNGGQFIKNTNVTSGTGGNERLDLTPTNSDKGMTCLTEENKNGECVSYYLCNDKKKIIDDGADILDLRNTLGCSHYLEVCCEINLTLDESDVENTVFDKDLHSVPTESPADPPSSSPPIQSTTPKIPLLADVEHRPRPVHNIPYTYSGTQEKVPRSECGWSNLAISPHQRKTNLRPNKITYALYGEYPFMIAVLKKSESDVWSSSDYVGGGALIHHRVVMTVAHNVKKMEAHKLKCRAGEYDTQTTKEMYPHQERNVEKIIVHENYYRPSLFNDIALLFLVSEFSPAPNVGIACLASTTPHRTDDCYSMGWGRNLPIEQRGHFALILKKVPLPLVSSSECENMLRRNSRLGPLFNLHESLTCAGGEADIDVCRGDGGSPLVCALNTNGEDKRYVVVGLVAVGLNCGHDGIPGLYTSIPHLYSWIVKQLDKENVEKQFAL